MALLAGLRRFYGPVIAADLQDDLGFGIVSRDREFRTLRVFNGGTTDLMILSINRVAGSSDFTLLPAPALPLAVAPGDQAALYYLSPSEMPGGAAAGQRRVETAGQQRLGVSDRPDLGGLAFQS